MLHEALMLEIYRQALNAGALPAARPRSTESANSSERCPSHDSNSSENARDHKDSVSNPSGVNHVPNSPNSAFPAVPQNLPVQPPSMEAYLHMVAAAAQQYGFPLGAAAASGRMSLPSPNDAHFKIPLQASPTATNYNLEALDFRTNLYGRALTMETPASEDEEEEDDDVIDGDNPLDLSVGPRKRSASQDKEPDSTIGQIQIKKIYKNDSPPQLAASPNVTQIQPPQPIIPNVNPYLAAVAAANIFRSGQFPDWNGKTDLVVDPLEKMTDIVKGPRKDKPVRNNTNTNTTPSTQQPSQAPATSTSTALPASAEGITKTRHNIWQSHWQNKGVASSVFRCVWCKQSFPTLEALTTHMKDSKHCGVNVPPFGNLPADRNHHQPAPAQHSHNLRKQPSNTSNQANLSANSTGSKSTFQYRGDPPTPLPRKLVRGQNVWLGKGVEQAMQILKCMRCGESFRSLGEMTKHMQETQHYTNILSQEQTLSMKSNSGESKDGQNSLSSEESRTLSAVLTCKVCDKAFNSLGELSTHMAKNNHYAEPLMQSMTGATGSRKRPAPKKREKSLPVRKLLELKCNQNESESAEHKQQRSFENAKRVSMDGPGIGPGSDKSDAALFAERMRQYISSVKSAETAAKPIQSPSGVLVKSKSPDIESKNGSAAKVSPGTSSVLSAIEQMFTTSFDTPPRHASAPATSPSGSSNKNASPVASSILKRLGIDETVDYNKPLIDTSDPFYHHFRYTSSERSGSECSVEASVEKYKIDATTPDKISLGDPSKVEQNPISQNADIKDDKAVELKSEPMNEIKVEVKVEFEDDATEKTTQPNVGNNNFDHGINNNNNSKERSVTPTSRGSPVSRMLPARSPTESHRSVTPKSPASSIKSYDGDKKYPSDSLNALSSMFDSLGSSGPSNHNNRVQPISNKIDSPENLSASNSLAALRQFCVKKEKTA